MNRFICIKESKGFTLGMTYYGKISSIKINKVETDFFECIDDTGWRGICPTSNMMPYNEWLALEREKQIKSVLDD